MWVTVTPKWVQLLCSESSRERSLWVVWVVWETFSLLLHHVSLSVSFLPFFSDVVVYALHNTTTMTVKKLRRWMEFLREYESSRPTNEWWIFSPSYFLPRRNEEGEPTGQKGVKNEDTQDKEWRKKEMKELFNSCSRFGLDSSSSGQSRSWWSSRWGDGCWSGRFLFVVIYFQYEVLVSVFKWNRENMSWRDAKSHQGDDMLPKKHVFLKTENADPDHQTFA